METKMIIFNVLMIMTMSSVLAQEWPRICEDNDYIESLEGRQMLSLISNCLMDGIVLKYKYPNKEGPYQELPVTPVDSSDCTFTAFAIKRSRGGKLFSCLVRGFESMDMSSVSAATLTERVRNNADEIVQSGNDYARENCTEDIMHNFNREEANQHEFCFFLEILKQISTAEGIMNQTGGFNSVNTDNDDDEGGDSEDSI